MVSLNEIQCIWDCIFLHVWNINSKGTGISTVNWTKNHLQDQKKKSNVGWAANWEKMSSDLSYFYVL